MERCALGAGAGAVDGAAWGEVGRVTTRGSDRRGVGRENCQESGEEKEKHHFLTFFSFFFFFFFFQIPKRLFPGKKQEAGKVGGGSLYTAPPFAPQRLCSVFLLSLAAHLHSSDGQ